MYVSSPVPAFDHILVMASVEASPVGGRKDTSALAAFHSLVSGEARFARCLGEGH
ncbi:MAG: hypothetical protein JNL25_14470 [Rhodospirillaceae bacterium]|nr:hypothetical protein [Rhodospirillaceae bacterium]